MPALSPDDTGQTALNWMDLFKVSHLPVVKNSEYIGLISDKYIYDNNLAESAIGGHLYGLDTVFITGEQHIYEAALAMYQSGISVLPVVTDGKIYRGSLMLNEIFDEFVHMLSLNEAGGIIVLHIPVHGYSLSQIGRVAEENDTKILSLNVVKPAISNMLNITMKLDKVELSPVLRSFERLGYQIVITLMDNSVIHDFYEDRLEHFKRYMNY